MSLNPHEGHGAPAVIGPYRIVRELGRGGMGVVYEAVHETLGKRVAIKVAHPQLRREAQFERFVREGRAACQIRHPHVVEVFELGTHAGAPYLVMALLDGISLEELLRASKQLPLPAVLELMLPIMSAVSAAHAAGVVHRDLKPSNIMLARGELRKLQPTLLDFGASKLEETNVAPLTQSGTLLGTLPYMAAEQVYASRNADALSDQYSLAVIVYECATGSRPFATESGYQLMQAIMTEPISRPSAREPSLPSELDAVLLRALQRDRSERYPSVRAFARALLPFASDEARNEWRTELEESECGARDVLESGLARGATMPDSERPAFVTRSYADLEPASRHADSRSSERALHSERAVSVPTALAPAVAAPPARLGTDSSSGLDEDTRSQGLPSLPRRRVPATAWIALAVTLTPAQLPQDANDRPQRTANMSEVDPHASVALEATSSTATVEPPAGADQTHTRSALDSKRAESPPSAVHAPEPEPEPEPERRVRRARAKRAPSLRAPSSSSQPAQPSTAQRTEPVREAVQLGRNGAPILE